MHSDQNIIKLMTMHNALNRKYDTDVFDIKRNGERGLINVKDRVEGTQNIRKATRKIHENDKRKES